MILRKRRLQNLRLYGVTDLIEADAGALRKIEAALRGGLDAVQLRSKVLPDLALVHFGRKIKKLAVKYGALFFVNDRVDICLALDADGVHLGQDDLPVMEARKLVGKNRLIGKSTHSLGQARLAQKEPVDYIGCGPIFGTPTKPDYQSVGLDLIGKVKAISNVPVVCIGGIGPENLDKVLVAGADRVAVVRAVFSAINPEQTARQMRAKITAQ